MPSSAEIFEGIGRMRGMIQHFGNISAFISPLILPVKNYSIHKMFTLLFEKVDCRIIDPRKRKRHDRMTARQIIFSETFGECRLEEYARRCLFLKSYQRARLLKPDLPWIAEGIGICFLGSIDKFNEILQKLLEFNRLERNRLMDGIRLNATFIDHYIGQFVFNQFEVHEPRLPRPPYGAMRW